MTINSFKPLFADYQAGRQAFLGLLSNPIAPKIDTSITDEDKFSLQDAMAKSTKRHNVKVIFAGKHQAFKAIEIGHLAYQIKQNVCFIACRDLTTGYIGETEKNIARLIADAENKNWILYFDEADALFTINSRETQQAPSDEEFDFEPLLLKRLMQYNGLIVLDLRNPSSIKRIAHLFDYTVNFA